MKAMTSLASALVTLFLPAAVLAQAPAETRSYCTTSFRSTSAASIPTYSFAVTTTRHPSVIITSYPVQTITAPPSTATLTSTTLYTTTVSAGSAETCTSTVIVSVGGTTSASATTTTVHSTVTTTVTQNGGTTTVPTRSGFVPIQTSAPQVSYQNPPNQARDDSADGLKRVQEELARRAVPEPPKALPFLNIQRLTSKPKGFNLMAQATPSAFPYEVGCLDLVTEYEAVTSTSTATSTVIKTAPGTTITSTRIISKTVTSSVGGGHIWTGTTITTTGPVVTATPTSTQVVTTTDTATYIHPSATSSAQCAQNNFGNTLRGDYGLSVSSRNNTVLTLINNTRSALECCELCANDPNCGMSAWDLLQPACYHYERCGDRLQVFSYAEGGQYFNSTGMFNPAVLPPLELSNGCSTAINCAQAGQVCI